MFLFELNLFKSIPNSNFFVWTNKEKHHQAKSLYVKELETSANALYYAAKVHKSQETINFSKQESE